MKTFPRKPSDKPKFIYLSYTAPHAPHAAPYDLREIVKQELITLNPGKQESDLTLIVEVIEKSFITLKDK